MNRRLFLVQFIALVVLSVILLSGCSEGGGASSGEGSANGASGSLVFTYSPSSHVKPIVYELVFDEQAMVEAINIENTEDDRSYELVRGKNFEVFGDAPSDQDVYIQTGTIDTLHKHEDFPITWMRTMAGVFSCFLPEKAKRFVRLGEPAKVHEPGHKALVYLEKKSGSLPKQARRDKNPKNNPYTDGKDLSGKTVTVSGWWHLSDEYRFDEAVAPFEHVTGIDVKYESSARFAREMPEQVMDRAGDGNLPDVLAIDGDDSRQFFFLRDLIENGLIYDVAEMAGMDYLREHYDEKMIKLTKIDDTYAGLLYMAEPTGLVWYNGPVFQEENYQLPETWEEMLTLTEQIAADGYTPWSIGIEASGVTGWVVIDWIDNIMLRIHPPEIYDRWVSGDLNFDSPEVRKAFDYLKEIWFNEEFIGHSRQTLGAIPYRDAAKAIKMDDPVKLMHRQRLFTREYLEEQDTVIQMYPLPPVHAEQEGRPVNVTGTVLTAMDDRPEVRAFLRYMGTGLSTKGWLVMSDKGQLFRAVSNGVVSPHKDTPLDWYTTPYEKTCAQVLQDATVLRRPALLRFPWSAQKVMQRQLTHYVMNNISLTEALQTIDEALRSN